MKAILVCLSLIHICKTDPSQYGRFTQDIAAAGNDTIIFVTDKTPSDYPSAAEADYFRAILNKYVEDGKTVFVGSCSGNAYCCLLYTSLLV